MHEDEEEEEEGEMAKEQEEEVEEEVEVEVVEANYDAVVLLGIQADKRYDNKWYPLII